MVSPPELKPHAANYFKAILGSTDMPVSAISTSDLSNLLPYRCSEASATSLLHPMFEEEITKTLLSLPTDKCPGPDSYPLEFSRLLGSRCGLRWLQ
ncbi:unnamed protein product [Microthlaspi erraticum]|uniref:Reverse transcriptase domain-containing protein n=1 Tax=Microthlaspi erraticum TaxID=1685480 RepID=A0A6D2K4I0_9BRAS|nr:unnamed protein product [Microthlaspi erraticum]